MNTDIDSLSASLTQEMAFSPLEKRLPPKLLYRFRKWMKQHSAPSVQGQVHKTVERAFEHIEAIRELKKNEVLASFYDNGTIRMDFGGDVDSKVKDAAMKWAKKRGLKTIEASLEKSDGSSSHVVLGASQAAKGIPVQVVKYTI